MNNLYIGLMSGTSVDGLDVAVVEIKNENSYKLIAYEEFKYSKDLKKMILKASENNSTTKEICELNFILAKFYADSIETIISNNNIRKKEINAIGSHGQTIYHNVEGKNKSTLQISDASVIANLTGISVVSDFRPAHIAAGGEGAPLVSFPEYKIFNSNSIVKRIWQNIGGISNSTLLSSKVDELITFDNGPGNMIIDMLCKMSFDLDYDESGKLASQGKIDKNILGKLMDDPYYNQPLPKTTGREKYNETFCKGIYGLTKNKYDLLRTVTFFTAKVIADSYKKYILKPGEEYEAIVSGGGAYNPLLIKDLKNELRNNENIVVKTSEEIGIDPSSKEAVAFAYLAYRTMNNEYSAIVNGRKVILGKISKYYG